MLNKKYQINIHFMTIDRANSPTESANYEIIEENRYVVGIEAYF